MLNLIRLSSRILCSRPATTCIKNGVTQSFRGLALNRQSTVQRPRPCYDFISKKFHSLPEEIRNSLTKMNISEPTPIQEKTLSAVLEKKDLVGIARTGSGKTLAFVIPAVMKILEARAQNPTCLVLAPTRELATQTNDVFRKFSHLGINSIVLVGGASRAAQVNQLNYRQHDVYIATPGRLNDLINTNSVNLSDIKYLVLDEADRMLDMGFEPQIRTIIERLPKERQTVMWSATWPLEIQSLAQDFMNEYEHIAIDSEQLKANPNINQVIVVCQPREKLNLMFDYLKQFKEDIEEPRTLIFVNTKRLADQLMLQLMRNRYKAISMHGDRTQRQRDDALRLFKNRLCHIMVATDVAARGLDINDISHVINFEFPNNIEDYIHRIGRTARHEKKGTAISFLTSNNAGIAKKLIRVLRETNQPVPDKLRQLATTQSFVFR